MRIRASAVIWLCLLLATPAWAVDPITAALARPPKSATLCGEKVPLELEDVRERFEKEMLLILWDKPQVMLWLKRTTRFLPFVAQELKKENLPEDLKFLPILESALLPHAGSPRGAIGFWQLMPETARKYGLRVDEFVDQRRDLFLSTPAALSYLKVLKERFPSWALAVAAYNMGEEGLDAEMLEQRCDDYYRLYLPLETQRFLLRLLAIKLIVRNPRAYGFVLEAQDHYAPLQFENAAVECLQETPLHLAAAAANTSFKRIKDLNPALRGHYLQAGPHVLRVPPGTSEGFAKRFQALVQSHTEQLAERIYVVQSGDSLSSIAAKFNVPVAALLIWNRIDKKQLLRPGNRLVIYPRVTGTEEP